MTGSFICECCNRTFPKGRTDEDTVKEYENTFHKKFDKEQTVEVCDGCFAMLMRDSHGAEYPPQ